MALGMGRLEGRHCCSDACVNFNLKALYVVCPPRPAPSEGDGLPGPSVLCVSNSESYCVRRSRGYFNCLATGELFNSMVSFYRYLFRRLLCSLCEIKALYAAAGIAIGLADRLLAVFFSVVRDSTLPSLANPKISSLTFQLTVLLACRTDRYVKKKYYACNSERLRKKHAGLLLNSIKHAKSSQLEAKSDLLL